MSSNCFSSNQIYLPPNGGDAYTYSTEAGVQDATVVGTLVGNDFGFKPLASGTGIQVDEATNPGSITFTNIGDLQLAYDNGQDITLDSGEITLRSANESAALETDVSNVGIYGDGDLILRYPNLLIFADRVYFIEAVFVGISTVNPNLTFTSKISAKLDLVVGVRHDTVLLNDENVRVDAIYSPFNVNFIFRTTDTYRISYSISAHYVDK